MNQYSYDDLDRRIIHALQLDGRVSYRRIAHVLGVSAQTVNRRYSHLRSAASLRVLGLTHPAAVGEESWFLRVRCTPGATTAVADALAAHHETEWVHVASGGAEIVCLSRNPEDAEPRLLTRLPRTPGVTSISAHCILHTYYGGAEGPISKVSPLGREQVEALRPEEPAADTTGPVALSELDRALLDVLQRDGRAGYRELARAGKCSQSTAQRRVMELRSQGVLYFDVDYVPEVLSRTKSVMLWLSVAPGCLDRAGRALAEHTEISFAASTTGATNLYAAVNCAGNKSLHRYLTGPVAALPGVSRLETAPVLRTLKRAGQELAGRHGPGTA